MAGHPLPGLSVTSPRRVLPHLRVLGGGPWGQDPWWRVADTRMGAGGGFR